MRAYIIGGGPAGAGAAKAFSEAGIRPVVIESQERLAEKPCGRGIMDVERLPIRIPKDVIMNRIRYVSVSIGRRWLFRYSSGSEGYVVDKRAMLEHAFAEVGAEIVYGSRYNHRTGTARIGGETVEIKEGILAAGFPFYDGDRIPVVQYIYKGPIKGVEYDTIEVHFNVEIMGYYYVFPYGDDVEVGVGGFASPQALWAMLDDFVKEDERFREARMLAKESSAVSVGGLKLGKVGGLVKAGEAAGFVMALTGEGIRPSILSGYAAAKALAEGRDPLKAQKATYIASGVEKQRKLLEQVEKMAVREREEIIATLPPEVHAEIAFGTFRLKEMLPRIATRPDLILRLVRASI